MRRPSRSSSSGRSELAAAQARAAEFAADVGLPADTGELAAVRDGLGAYRVALAALWPAAEAAHAAIRAAADAESGARRQPPAAA